MIQPEFRYAYPATATTASIATGHVLLHSINVPKASAGAITVLDASGNTYFAFPSATVAGTYIYDITLSNGLSVLQASAADQVVYAYQT